MLSLTDLYQIQWQPTPSRESQVYYPQVPSPSLSPQSLNLSPLKRSQVSSNVLVCNWSAVNLMLLTYWRMMTGKWTWEWTCRWPSPLLLSLSPRAEGRFSKIPNSIHWRFPNRFPNLRKMNELRQYLGKSWERVNFQKFLVKTYAKVVQYLGKILSRHISWLRNNLRNRWQLVETVKNEGRDSGMEELCEMIEKDLSRSTTCLHAVSNDNQSSRQ